MKEDDKNPNTLRNFSQYKIGFQIIFQGCQKRGGCSKQFGNIARSQKANPVTTHSLSRCQVVLIKRQFFKKIVFLGLVFFWVLSEFEFLVL